MCDDVERIELLGIFPVALQDRPAKIALKRRELEAAFRVAWENEVIQSVAEPADAVIQNEVALRLFHVYY